MDANRKDLLVARVLSGSVRIRVNDKLYFVRRPSRDDAYCAAELYFDVLRRAELDGLYSDAELEEFLYENGFWDGKREEALRLIPRQIEDAKVALFKATFKSNERRVIRKALETAKAELARLTDERHAYSYLSCAGAAAVAKNRYLLGASLFTAGGERVFGADFWDAESGLLDAAVSAYAEARMTEAEVRELARTEPWRSLWASHKAEGSLFGVPPADWTDDQRSLAGWSVLYDNVHQHPECPPDDVLDDDDILDGWFIVQKRNRGKAGSGDVVSNEKIAQCDEQYLVADTVEDARRVVELNDEHGRAIQSQRFSTLKKKGEMSELEMPDTALRLRAEITQRLAASMKGG